MIAMTETTTAGSKLKQIRDIAMKTAKEYEIRKGRNPDDSPSKKRKVGYDIESGSRKIEVCIPQLIVDLFEEGGVCTEAAEKLLQKVEKPVVSAQ
jgi:hypothetical protein